jgi:hypothetical protein
MFASMGGKGKKKRINYKKMTRFEAQKMLDESRGMPRAQWQKLWTISRKGPRS